MNIVKKIYGKEIKFVLRGVRYESNGVALNLPSTESLKERAKGFSIIANKSLFEATLKDTIRGIQFQITDYNSQLFKDRYLNIISTVVLSHVYKDDHDSILIIQIIPKGVAVDVVVYQSSVDLILLHDYTYTIKKLINSMVAPINGVTWHVGVLYFDEMYKETI